MVFLALLFFSLLFLIIIIRLCIIYIIYKGKRLAVINHLCLPLKQLIDLS
jgi:hypothetical protein